MYDASLVENRPKNIHLSDGFNVPGITSNALIHEPEALRSGPARGILLAVALSLTLCWIPLILVIWLV